MPKLPADLPENWTQGQTISPNGTETGLTEQHGYNYLMKQVNNTQTEVNNINDALTDVAQQATVNEINNKIGTEADADTQPTLFGRLAQLKNVLLEKLAEVITKITGVDSKIGTSGDTAGTATLFGQVKDISEKMPTGTIKSIQHGMFRWSSEMNTQGTEIVISTVNPEKCIVMLSCSGDDPNAYRSIGEAAVKKLEPEKLSLYVAGSASLLFVWCVIECF